MLEDAIEPEIINQELPQLKTARILNVQRKKKFIFSYEEYIIHTETSTGTGVTVSRTYQDFKFLHASLVTFQAGLKVPALPQESASRRPLGVLDQLNQFISLLLSHPQLSQSIFLSNFLLLHETEFAQFKGKSQRIEQFSPSRKRVRIVPDEIKDSRSELCILADKVRGQLAASQNAFQTLQQFYQSLAGYDAKLKAKLREAQLTALTIYQKDWEDKQLLIKDLELQLGQSCQVGSLKEFVDNWGSDFRSYVERIGQRLQWGNELLFDSLKQTHYL